MRKPLAVFTFLLILSGVAVTVFAGWPFGKRATSPKISASRLAAIRSAVDALEPTPTEAAAIKAFRQKTFDAYMAASTVDPAALPTVAAASDTTPVNQVPEFDPDGPQVSVEFRFLAAPESVAKMIIGNKAMRWSTLTGKKPTRYASAPGQVYLVEPGNTNGQNAQNAQGVHTRSTQTNVPMLVRFVENVNAVKFMEIFQSDPQLNILQAPKVTLFNGQTGAIEDVSRTPFVTGVLPAEGDYDTAYQPLIEIVDEGQRLTIRTEIVDGKACRLSCTAELSKIEDVEIFKVVDDGSSGVSIQIPKVLRSVWTIPEIDVPEGMSLIMALPGETRGESCVFLMVTPRIVAP